MAPSSTGVLLGLPLEVIQPSRVLPSKRRSQPSAFSFAVNSLSAAGAGAVTIKTARHTNTGLILAHHLFLLGVPGHRLSLPIGFDGELDRDHGRRTQFGVAV